MTGTAEIDGVLELGNIVGTNPDVGQVFTVISSATSLTGQFSSVEGQFVVDVRYLTDRVEVEVLALSELPLFSDGFE